MIDKGELLESRAVTHWIYTQSARGEPVVSIRSQAAILHKNFDHFKYTVCGRTFWVNILRSLSQVRETINT